MKTEINPTSEKSEKGAVSNEITVQSPTCNVAIDVGHILAANQALLKNMARKMGNLEKKISNLENAYCEQTKLLQISRRRQLMLQAPSKKVDVWSADIPELDDKYLEQFSVIDRVFRPWKMRRPNQNN